MDSLAKSLYHARVKNIDSRYFIPDDALKHILTDDTILKHVQGSAVEVYHQREMIEAITNGGRRLFAILTLLSEEPSLIKFVERDQMVRKHDLDSRLPLTLEALEKIFENGTTALLFHERQWELLSPFFCEDKSHRMFDGDTVFPFVGIEDLPDGGFGKVSRLTLNEAHHGFSWGLGSKVSVIQKTIKPLDDDDDKPDGSRDSNEDDTKAIQNQVIRIKEAFKREERILTLLRALRHPSIISLVASYTSHQTANLAHFHHLLFPCADSDLFNILRNKSHDALKHRFKTDYSLFQALHGLASAIESVHNYVSGEFNLTLIGCHYDLNPRNILIQGDRFLLADFGLSRLEAEGSRSIFKQGKGDYLAPECEPLDQDTFSKGAVGREGDIWSFGCVLLEILTYRLWQGQGVEAFRTKRRTKIFGCYTAYQFHAFGSPQLAVEEELKRMKEDCPKSWQDVVVLIEQMLSIEPKSRPKAPLVTAHLYVFAEKLLYKSCLEAFEELAALSSDLQLVVERQRFAIWGWGAGLVEDDGILEMTDGQEDRNWLTISRQHWGILNQRLIFVQEEANLLKTTLGSGQMLRPVYMSLRELNDGLWSLTPPSIVQRMLQVLHGRMIDSDDTDVLKKTTNAFGSFPPYEDIALLAAIKYMTTRVDAEIQRGNRLLLLNEPVQVEGTVGVNCLGKISNREGSTLVVIEWMEYGPHWMTKANREELFDRVEAVAELFCKAKMPRRVSVLRCSGYFHCPSRNSFGLIYDFPAGTDRRLKPLTMKHILRQFSRPILGDLYELARDILECILNVHKAGWLHKSISAYNILFFDVASWQLDTEANSIAKIMDQSPSRNFPQPLKASKTKLAHPSTASENKPRQGRISKTLLGGFRNKGAKAKEVPEEPSRVPVRKDASMSQSSQAEGSQAGDPNSREHPALLKTPYLVGFNHSRPDEDFAFTQGPSTDHRQMLYQHPEYTLRSKAHRFKSSYDYYSIGLLLLEIGLWKPLSELTDKPIDSYTPKEQRRLWLTEFVPRLGATMGAIYRDAVRVCLSGELGDETGSQMVKYHLRMLFEVKVVNQIERCCA